MAEVYILFLRTAIVHDRTEQHLNQPLIGQDFGQHLARRGVPAVVVTHDVLFARSVADRGVYLSKGRVMDTGDVETIIEHVQAGKLVDEPGGPGNGAGGMPRLTG